ncbi:MAG: ABC transporter permease [Veillonella sp.]
MWPNGSKNLFADEDPVGKEIRVKNIPFRVIGVLKSKGNGTMGNDQDDTVLIYIPHRWSA